MQSTVSVIVTRQREFEKIARRKGGNPLEQKVYGELAKIKLVGAQLISEKLHVVNSMEYLAEK